MLCSTSKSLPSFLSPSNLLRPATRAIATLALATSLSAPALAAAINVNKTFTPDAVAAGQPSKVTFYFLNANVADATSLAFIDALPTGMFVAPTPNIVTNCLGTLTAIPGDTSVSFSGGTVPKAVDTTPGKCDVSFDVVVPSANVLINSVPAGEVTSSQGSNLQSAEATLNVTGLAPISGVKGFSPNYVHGYLPAGSQPIPTGGKSTVTITLTNPNSVALTNVAFTDYLPSTAHPTAPIPAGGIVVSPVPNASTSCGGTLTAVAGATSVSLSGGTIPAGGTCAVSFDVIAESPTIAAQGNIPNTIPMGGVTTFEGPTNSTFSANVNRETGGSVIKSFSPSTVGNNGASLLTITVRNYNAAAVSGIKFTDTLPAGMTIASPTAQPTFTSGDCQFATSTVASGFAVSAPAGGSAVTVTAGGLVATGASANPTSCTIRVNVVGANATQDNLNLDNAILAGTWDANVAFTGGTARLTVQPTTLITGTKSFTPAAVFQGQSSVATIKLTNASGVTLNSFNFNDNIQGSMGGGITVLASPAPTNDCGMTPTITGDSKQISFAGGTLAAGATCTVTFSVQTLLTTTTGGKTNTLGVGTVKGTRQDNATQISNRIAISGVLTVNAPATASKAFSPSTIPAGTDSLLTITITRPAGAPTWDAWTITDPMPTGHLVSNTAAPAPTPPTVACAGTLAVAGDRKSLTFTGNPISGASASSCVIRVYVTAPSGAGSAQNSIPVNSFAVTMGDTIYKNSSAINATLTRVTGSVTLTKSFNPAVVDLLGTSTMFLRIVNTAQNALNLTGVHLEDNLPTGLVLAAVPNPQFTGTGCSLGTLTAPAGGNKVTLDNATVNAGRICTIQVLTQALAAGNLINQVPVGALQTAQLISNLEPVAATVTSTGLASLSVTKTDGVTELKAGGTTTYTIVVSNADLANVATVAGATFTDTPPTGMTFDAWSCVPSTGAVCAPSGSGPIVDSVTIPKGSFITYTVNATLAADYAQSTVKNCATIQPPATVIDVSLTDNEACDTDNVPRGLILKKLWSNALEGDAITATTTGLVNNATVTSTADATGINTTTGTQVFNLAGGTVTLPTEQFTNGSSSNYTTTLSCTGVQLAGNTAPQSFEMPNVDVVCTYTNTRVERKLTLVKKWVNAKEGHALNVTTTGLANNATLSSTADATGNNTTTGATVSNVAGGTVTLPAESFTAGTQAEYTTTLACEGATASQAVPPATFTMPENDVTCTYTNTRVTYTVKLIKTWIDGKSGDAITVSTQGLASNASVTSTSTGNNTDAGSTASNPPGATVTLPTESFTTGTPTDYTTTVACTGAELSGNAPGATFTMPAGNVECTYTNQRKRLEVNAVAACINDVPYVDYTVTPFGFTPGTDPVTIQWFDSTNTLRLTLTGLPLNGRLLWPGAAIDIDGFPTDWPGWDLIGGVWVEVNDGLRQPMRIVVSVNPSVEVNVTYPTGTAACAPPKRAPPPPPLASAVPVGSPEGLALMAALLALMGAWSARRRARR